ncbi:metallophosphoesterase [Flavobacterium sp. 120]|uniref:metallophosphoesterase n=1 Tax=Flavobacterium sp. 120 TaxID=2135626 RepID=UPI000EAC5FA6|nr:metallophosphoesterase [Flavobacterium sp. 120]RKS15525.1 3',5'-cyclic AMP phosphodiesterase CpdA [Flavobacterium sp. 120]
MKILHITDLHFKDNTNSIYSINKIIDKIYEENKDKDINYIFFTGDLVFSGKSIDDFRKANEILLRTLASKLKIEKKNVFICGGNHDVHRDQEMSVIKDKLLEIKSEEALNTFLEDHKQYEASLMNIRNYLLFQDEFYNENVLLKDETDEIKDLYTVHKRISGEKIIHVITINTSWRANDSNTDEGKLLFPSKMLKEVILKLPKNDFKILLLHHPITDLKHWNRVLLEDIIYDNFHVMMHGHIHRAMNSSIIKNSDGIVNISTDASLSKINDYEHIGYTIVELDINDMNVKLSKFRIDSDYMSYPNGTQLNLNIPIDENKRELLDFRKKVSRLYESELGKAREIFVSNSDASSSLGDLFSEPILKTSSSTSINSIAKKNDSSKIISVEHIENDFTNNYFIYGKDKFGKTSILYYLYVSYLKNVSKHKVLPIYIDCNIKSNNIGIEDFFIKTYQINKTFFSQLLGEYQIRLLLDNYNKIDTSLKQKVEEFIENNKNVSYVTSLDENILSDFVDIKIDSTTHIKLYIHDLTTTQVRSITKRTLNCDAEKTEDIIVKIKSIFKQLNLPMNYWTVSLFLWIFNNSSEQNFHNNFELIELYIDNLLDRKNIVVDREIKIEYDALKIFLSELAINLVKNYHENNYSIKYADLVRFTEEYKTKNKRFVISTETVIKLITEKGIIKQINEDYYTFRLKGVFEYFIAFYLKDHPETRDEIINDDKVYLSFGNELELVSGFNKRDSDFLSKIFNKSYVLFQPINDGYKSIGNTDEVLINRSTNLTLKLNDYKSGLQSLIKKDDDILNEEFFPIANGTSSGVSAKRIYEKIALVSENLEKVLFILSRVYRNSSVDNEELNNKVLDFILESACNLCFLIIDEKNSKDELDEGFSKVFTNFVPLVIQNFLFDALAQNNLEVIFLDKIKELKETQGNELKIFILYYMIIDLDLKNNKKYIEEVLNYIKINVLRHASLFKLFSLLLFKKYNSEHNKKFIEDAAVKQAKTIDNSRANIESTEKTIRNIGFQSHLKK